MLSTRLWLKTQRLFAVVLEDPALSNIWAPTVLKKPSVKKEKALALWMNSSLGLLLALLVRVPTRGPWIQFKKPNLGAMLVLDVGRVPNRVLDKLEEAYDQLADNVVLSYAELGTDETRAAIDKAIEKALGLSGIDVVRKLLGREPVVCNEPLVGRSRIAQPVDSGALLPPIEEEEVD